MDEAALREKVDELLSEVQRLPGRWADEPRSHGGASQGPGVGIRREMASLEDGLDHIRVAVKYLVFDLEATKRENRLLRSLLGES